MTSISIRRRLLGVGLAGCVLAAVLVAVAVHRGPDVTDLATTPASAMGSVAELASAPAGIYRYRTLGSQMSSAAGIASIDGLTTAEVSAVTPTADEVEQDIVRTGPSGTTATRLRYTADGIYATRLAFVTPSAYALEFQPSDPVRLLKLPAASGATWSWTASSLDGATSVDATFTVLRDEAVTIAGQPRETHVVAAVFELDGAVNGRIEQVVWRSAADGSVVKERVVADGRNGSTIFRSDVRLQLESEDVA